jgi:ABC-type transporter MlaC component
LNSPAKTPPDSQSFSLNPTNTTTLRLLTSLSTIARTQTIAFAFNATYLNGAPATTGTAQLRVTEPDGVTLHVITAAYDTTQQSFTASYTSSLVSATGIWAVTLYKDAFNDTYGNNGPLSSLSSTFGVGTAILTITNQLTTATYSTGNIIPIVSRIQTPSGANFVQGTVTAMITTSGRSVTSPISLVYDQTQGKWIGSYKVDASDPSGTWLLTVQAQDAFGNSGGTTSSFTVNTPGTPNPIVISLTMWAWLIAVLLAVGLGFAILIFRQRNVSHREVKLDLTAIHSKAEEVKSDDFLQSIKTQLKRRTDMMAEDKKETREKHD